LPALLRPIPRFARFLLFGQWVALQQSHCASRGNWDWTGLNATDVTSTSQKPTSVIVYQPGKTLWDWLQLLIIPAVLAVAGYVINLTISRGEQAATEQRSKSESEAAEKRAETEREIATDNQREAALQAYLDKMSELLLEKKLRDSTQKDEIQRVARIQTLTVLRGLDSIRKAIVIQFLYESDLIYTNKCIIGLSGANLSEAKLRRANLSGVRLNGADLGGADLSRASLLESSLQFANLTETDLSGADLTAANLSLAHFSGTKLSGADLRNAILKDSHGITIEELEKQAKSLEGTIMPDGSIHE
jgi:uncharacterized protein YjbI with pentapeptide repeats